MTKFIKQEAQEKANEIKVLAEEVSLGRKAPWHGMLHYHLHSKY